MNEKRPLSTKHRPKGLEIIHEDRDIIVVDKAAGVMSIGAGKEGVNTAYSSLTRYVKKGNPKSHQRVFIVHRLDRETSGVLVFAKTEEAKVALQDNWDTAKKIYWAIVDGIPPEQSGTISSHLAENDQFQVYSTPDSRKGKLSHTRYRVLKTLGPRALLEIYLVTGRKHQIRVHLADKGWPICGDGKYGNRVVGTKRLALHARTLTITHPHTGVRMTFEAPVPPSFYKLARGPVVARRGEPVAGRPDAGSQREPAAKRARNARPGTPNPRGESGKFRKPPRPGVTGGSGGTGGTGGISGPDKSGKPDKFKRRSKPDKADYSGMPEGVGEPGPRKFVKRGGPGKPRKFAKPAKGGPHASLGSGGPRPPSAPRGPKPAPRPGPRPGPRSGKRPS